MNPVKLLETMDLEQLLQIEDDDLMEDMIYDAMRKMEQELPPDENFFLPMKMLDEYHSSEEYLRLSENVREYKNSMLQTAQQYLGKRQELEQTSLKKLNIQKYGKGGPCHRGPLHPGNMEILLGSGHRKGRLLKQSKSPDHIYGFDSDNRLLFCESKADRTTEYLIRDENRELGVTFGRNEKIAALSEVTYDLNRRLKDYRYAKFEYGKRKLRVTLCCELYEYHEREIYVDWIRAEGKYPECEHFHFLCDSDGFVLKGECCNVMHKLILDVEIPRGTKL